MADTYIQQLTSMLRNDYQLPETIISEVMYKLGEAPLQEMYSYNILTTYRLWDQEITRFGKIIDPQSPTLKDATFPRIMFSQQHPAMDIVLVSHNIRYFRLFFGDIFFVAKVVCPSKPPSQ